ncbi:hypothetical protein AOLI_G00251610 [Acnodon oligacanthus]
MTKSLRVTVRKYMGPKIATQVRKVPETPLSARRESRLEAETRGWLELHANFSQLFAPQENAEILPSPHVGNGGEVWPRPLLAPIGSLEDGSEVHWLQRSSSSRQSTRFATPTETPPTFAARGVKPHSLVSVWSLKG